jgi:hypothetical protein
MKRIRLILLLPLLCPFSCQPGAPSATVSLNRVDQFRSGLDRIV